MPRRPMSRLAASGRARRAAGPRDRRAGIRAASERLPSGRPTTSTLASPRPGPRRQRDHTGHRQPHEPEPDARRTRSALTLQLRDAGRSWSTASRRSRTRRAARSTGSSSTRRRPPRRDALRVVQVDGAHVAAPGRATRRIVVPLGGVLAAGDTVDGPRRTTPPRCGTRWPARTGCSRGPTASSTRTAGSRGSAGRRRSTARTTATRS